MSDEEPTRLKSAGGTPEELVRALQALGRDRDAARLARVAERLDASLAASGTATAGWLTGAKLGGAGLVIGVLGLLGYTLLGEPAAPAASTQALPAHIPQAAAEPIAEPAAEHTPVAEPARTQPRPAEATRERAARTRSAAPRATRSDEEHAHASTRTPIAEGSRDAAAPARTPSAEPSSSAERTAPRAAEPVPAAIEAPTPAPAPAPEAQRSEEALLREARTLAPRDPRAALRLLDEHRTRFASGLLVPERELLAIETLRRLDRHAEADARLKQFEARYPSSIHLRRLSAGRSGARDE